MYPRNDMGRARLIARARPRCSPWRRPAHGRALRASRSPASPPPTCAGRTARAARSRRPQLRLVQLSYWGFDGRPHTGALVVNASVVPAVEQIFGRLYAAPLPDPQHGAGRRLPRQRRSLDGGRQHLGVQLPVRGREPARSAGRFTPTARRSTSIRSRTRTCSPAASSRRPAGRTSTAPTSGPEWPSRAASSSTAFAAAGLAVGRPLDRLAGLPALLRDRRLTVPA